LLGSATPQGWESKQDIRLKETAQPGVYTAERVQLSEGEFKFRYGNDWTVNLGGPDKDGYLTQDGCNISTKAGTFDVTLDLRHFGSPSFSLTISQ
jgi:starch-binding outer membrane protein SusE/F